MRHLSRSWTIPLVIAFGLPGLGGLGAIESPAMAGGEPPDPPKASSPTVVVHRVIDGDTLDVRGDGRIVPKDKLVRVRLLEIDAPERGTCYAKPATARTRALLPRDSTALVVHDDRLKDRYGRYLLYLWNEKKVFVNKSLVRSGHADAVLFQPNDKYWSTISRAEKAARQAGAGLWSACPGAPKPPQTPKPPDTPPPPPPSPANPGLPPGPPAGIPDLDCSDLPGPVWVGSDDPHRLDRDGDGIGCDAD